MKILLLFLITLNVFAGSYLPESMLGQDTAGIIIHTKKERCEKQYSPDKCIDISGYDVSISKVRPEKQLKDLAQNCTDDCQEKLKALACEDNTWQAIKTENEVYCTKLRPKAIVVDADKKAIKDAEKAAKIQEKLDRKAEILELKGFLSDINDSDLPSWHKKILKKLVRDLKED